MSDFTFEAFGTGWSLTIDGADFPETLKREILQKTTAFEQAYSRFIPSSEAVKFRDLPAGKYSVSPQLAEMLQASAQLRTLTDGGFDPAIATLFEKLGYNQDYDFVSAPATAPQNWQPPDWQIADQILMISGPIVFDIGGIGKGYWIDQLSSMLNAAGFPHHLVDGGGDMMATTKQNGEGWRVALEWPGKPDTALGIVELRNQGLAVSDTYKRRWKNWHHLISAETKHPLTEIVGLMAVAPTAFQADQCTSGLAFGRVTDFMKIATFFHAEYLLFHEDQTVETSQKWRGELFT